MDEPRLKQLRPADTSSSSIRGCGGDVQLAYPEEDMVRWTELQVWIGVHQRDTAAYSIFECPGGFEKSRRGSRLARPYLTFKSDPQWIPNDQSCSEQKSQQNYRCQQSQKDAASSEQAPMEEC